MSDMNKVKSWADGYFKKGIFCKEDIHINDDKLVEGYQMLFAQPLCKILGLEFFDDLKNNHTALSTLKTLQSTFPDYLYYLNDIASKSVKYNTPEKIQKRLKTLFANTEKFVYICPGSNRTFIRHKKDGELMGKFPPVQMVELCPLSAIPNGSSNDAIIILQNLNPKTISDTGVKALTLANEHGCCDVEQLRTVNLWVPTEDSFELKKVNSLYEYLPSRAVRELIISIPEASITEYGNPYVAAYELFKDSKEYAGCREEIGRLVAERKSKEISEEDVNKYIQDKYGKTLEELIQPQEQTLTKQSIDSYCDLNGINRGCTIVQLCNTFDGIKSEPISDIDVAINVIKKSNSFSDEMSDNIINSLTMGSNLTIPSDDIRKALNVMQVDKRCSILQLMDKLSGKEIEYNSDSVIRSILLGGGLTVQEVDKLIENKFQLNIEDEVVKTVEGCSQLPQALKPLILQSVVDDMPFTYSSVIHTCPNFEPDVRDYLKEVIDENDVVNFDKLITELLYQSCISREDVEFLKERNFHVDVKSEVKKVIRDCPNIEQDIKNKLYDALFKGEKFSLPNLSQKDEDRITMPETDPLQNDIGYKGAHTFLREVRSRLLENDSVEFRMEIASINSVFTTLVMLGEKYKIAAEAVMESNYKRASAECKKIIEVVSKEVGFNLGN